ncbi:hypothetical protein ACTQ4K_14975 [Clostridium sporogenes]|uniref:hypothetical protein n=1 Tax=Clostridium sporogenes TaxID=1509 RepID=UPI003F8ED61E
MIKVNGNWCTLAIAIFYKRPKEDIEDMIKLRQQGCKFKEIGEIFCLTPSTVRNFVSSFKKKKAPCQEPNN